MSLVAGATDQYAAQVTFTSGVDPSATALTWQIGYAGGALESGRAHQAQVDVVDHATFALDRPRRRALPLLGRSVSRPVGERLPSRGPAAG